MYLKITEAAKLMGIHSDTLRNWSDGGLFPTIKTGAGHRRYNIADILAWQQTQKQMRELEKALAKSRR